MSSKPLTPLDRTEIIKLLISKWERKNRDKQPVFPADKAPLKLPSGKAQK